MNLLIAARYFLSHKRQTFVCIAGVAIAVMMYVSMSAMMQGFSDKFIIETVESTGHLAVNDEPREVSTPILERAYPDAGPDSLLGLDGLKPREQVKKIKNPTGLMTQIRALPGVVAVAPETNGQVVATYGTKTMPISIVGCEPSEQVRVTTIGEKLTAGEFRRLRSTADGIIIGRGVALVLGAQLGDSITLAADGGGRANARVVGIFDTGVTPVDYSRGYMLINASQTLLNKKNVVNRINVRLADYTQAREVAAQIESISGYKTQSWQESNANFLQIFTIQNMITAIITGALLVVAAFGVLNILIMAVLERVNDIAILKSFGLARKDITLIYVYQGMAIGLIGAAVGVLCAKGVITVLRNLPVKVEGLVKSEGILVSESGPLYVQAFIAAVVVTILAAVYPAYRAAKYDPVEVIRGAH